jgi:antitoxin VapB
MPLYIRDDATAELVAKLAKARGTTKQDAVKFAVMAELARNDDEKPLRERMKAWREAHPFPPPTGLKADKAFFDDLSGEP